MANNDNETKQFDCSRGCSVEQNPDNSYDCNYRPGCCKLQVYDWLHGVTLVDYKDLFEVRFKNTRKGIFVNSSGQSLKTGDLVVVEAATGHDLGIVTLEGAIVLHQMVSRHIDPATTEFKKIYRKARQMDIDRWREAIGREHQTMIRSRQLAARLGLEMKIGDVEFQGDGTKAIFYYIAAHRVDFRQLIKDFAEEFHIRVEMKQIGSRQEAGLIGGLGICGRELCCSNHITAFQSISTTAARIQDLSLNPVKLAGQCGNLKCCLNYEAAVYNDAQGKIPKVHRPLELEDGQAWLMKTDILRGRMFFSYDQGSFANLYELTADDVRAIQRQNNAGIKPASLNEKRERKAAAVSNDPGFVTAVGDDSISRFDKTSKNKHRHKRRHGKGGFDGKQG
ncbi:MAG: hypothetical protein HUJ95_00780 [Bacteroidales bacterium]|nr:hypothetical protein [Bacteroidales bacterium]